MNVFSMVYLKQHFRMPLPSVRMFCKEPLCLLFPLDLQEDYQRDVLYLLCHMNKSHHQDLLLISSSCLCATLFTLTMKEVSLLIVAEISGFSSGEDSVNTV